MENHSFGLIFKSQIRKTSNWIIQNPHPPLPHHYEQVISSYLTVRWPLLHQFEFYQGKASAVFCTLATMNKRLQNGLCNRMISHGQRILKMHSSHISYLTRLFLWSKLLAKNTNFKEWEFSAVLVASNALKFSLWVWRGNPMCGHCNDMIATQCVCLSDGDDYNVVQGVVNR